MIVKRATESRSIKVSTLLRQSATWFQAGLLRGPSARYGPSRTNGTPSAVDLAPSDTIGMLCGVEVLDVDGVRVAVRRSPRARRVRLVAKAGCGVELVLPARGGEQTGRELIATHRDWIAKQNARLEQRVLGLEQSGVVWRHGTAIPLTLRHADRARVMSTDDQVIIATPSAGDAGRLIERWYREHTRAVAEALIADLPEPHPTTLRIADGTSRWGSCSRTGTISLSWRLMLAPFPILDYVVVHELCHLRHLNHSAKFWAEVETLRPDWHDAHLWLRQHGSELHAYEPAFAVQPLRVAA